MDHLDASGAQFHTTQWNLVLIAGEADRGQAEKGRDRTEQQWDIWEIRALLRGYGLDWD